MLKKTINIVISFLILITIWQIIFIVGDFNEALFPSVQSVFKAFGYMFGERDIWKDVLASLYRFSLGYIFAVVLGVLLGIVFGWYSKLFAYINPIIQILRPISPVAWLPIFVLLLGIGDSPAILIIFIAAFFPILLSTVTAIKSVDSIYFKIAKNFGFNSFKTIWKIIFPEALPQIFQSFHIALGSAWVFLVAGEMSGAQTGLGFLIIDARNNLRTDILIATMLIIGIIGLLLDSGIRLLEMGILKKWGFYGRKGKQ